MEKQQPTSAPVPDPTVLTTAQLVTAIEALKDLLRAEVHGRAILVDARFQEIERANVLRQQIFDQQPKIVDAKIEHLERLHGEKFESIQTQFRERDTRTEQSAKDSKVAIDAALQAQKEAVVKQQESSDRAIGKSELATSKQIDAIGSLIASNTKAADEKIDDMKQRLTRIEGASAGTKDAGASHNTSTSMMIAGAGVLIALIVGGSTLLARRDDNKGVPQVQYVPSAVPVPVPATKP